MVIRNDNSLAAKLKPGSVTISLALLLASNRPKGRTRGMLAVIEKRHRLGNIGQARAAVYRAREMGLLGGRKPGRAHGVLTAKAKAVLASRPAKRKRGTKVRPSRRPQRGKAEG